MVPPEKLKPTTLNFKSSILPLVGSTGNIQIFGHCIATWYAMSQSHVKLTEIGTTKVNRMCRSRRVLATGGKQTEYGWTGSVFIHFYFL